MTTITDSVGSTPFDTSLLFITQTGSVISADQGVTDTNINDAVLVNYGIIYGYVAVSTNQTMALFNEAGSHITGSYQSVDLLGSGARVMNEGSIEGGAEGLHIESAGANVQNSGTIAAGTGFYLNVEGDRGVIVNAGIIQGDTNAFYKEGGGTLTMRNSGTIDGDVTLIDGTNTFNGHGGTVTGEIKGGTGADTILAGSDGETLGGGKGHDRLVGGTGADTFVFSSYSSADSDVVKGFNVSNDTIQFDHTVFTHLAADVTPAFAIGTTASSATDFLFYNSGTGNLYYDVDGNKTAHSPFLVANLGTGLKLTAGDFSVV